MDNPFRQRKGARRRLKHQQRQARMRAYRASGTDEDAAAKCGMTAVGFRAWRLASGLPALAPIGRPRNGLPVPVQEVK